MMEKEHLVLDADNNDLHLTKKQIKHKVKHQNKSSFNSVAEEHLSDLLKLKKFNQHSGENPRVNHFKSYTRWVKNMFNKFFLKFWK